MWTEERLISLIDNKVEESLTLDYKACNSLATTDGKKNELSKDVSAFANSAGGTIIYGMVEGTGETKHLPEKLDEGFNPSEISKEWLEQVINSRIQRRISGIVIHPVELTSTSPGKFAYVVEIPQSTNAPHQASDKKFYKRFNFESVPMEEFEIRDVMNRQAGPDLWLEFCETEDPMYDNLTFDLVACLKNKSSKPANTLIRTIWFDTKIIPMQGRQVGEGFKIDEKSIIPGIKVVEALVPQAPIFGTHVFDIYSGNVSTNPRLSLQFNRKNLKYVAIKDIEAYIKWELESPDMVTRYGIHRLSVRVGEIEREDIWEEAYFVEVENLETGFIREGMFSHPMTTQDNNEDDFLVIE